ncbi:lytic transglycosylase domain-containing protein [Pseudobacteroides cellulosolvens]|uniref:Lytic transglycosylase catalytic n=1 Tax=Pseudobacteroides cellulosolvens ATCC 35603 = DSM 2933 TaxID=398512 RepID=A0A0L6JHP9_9FIRM|nr:lytic transglycosylase domain-containing protein [Pseudobacteroides cellulosolvens]KNY25225.1 Lytic transglycosylase catalytic [Pseudobacteroides cellulosolvens ATCC 35603 = DSM 2933]
MSKIKKIIVFFILLILIAGISVSGLIIAAKRVYPVKYKDSVIKYSTQYGIDPYMVLSVIKAESNFRSTAVSPKKAMGLMQITEDTGKWAAGKMKIEGFEIDDLFEPDTNIRIGCWYLHYLEDQFEDFNNATDDEKIEYVLASYNGGKTNVLRWIKNAEKSENGIFSENITFKETKHYLKKVKGNYDIYKMLYKNI